MSTQALQSLKSLEVTPVFSGRNQPGAASSDPLLEVLGCERPSVSELFTEHCAGLGFMDDG